MARSHMLRLDGLSEWQAEYMSHVGQGIDGFRQPGKRSVEIPLTQLPVVLNRLGALYEEANESTEPDAHKARIGRLVKHLTDAMAKKKERAMKRLGPTGVYSACP